MARSNRHKYNNLDYVLMGRPGSRRWHKREVDPQRRVEGGLAFLNSAAALRNRNERELDLIKHAWAMKPKNEQERREKRRGMIRGLVYGAIVGGFTLTVLAGAAKTHASKNAKAIEVELGNIKNLMNKRSALYRSIMGGGYNALDSAIGVAKNAGRLVNLPGEYKYQGGLHLGDIKDADSELVDALKNMKRYIESGSGKNIQTKRYLEKIDAFIQHVANSNMSRMAHGQMTTTANGVRTLRPDALISAINNKNKELYEAAYDEASGFIKISDIRAGQPFDMGDFSPNEAWTRFIGGNTEDLSGITRKDGIADRSADFAKELRDTKPSEVAGGLISDIRSTFRVKRSAASEALRGEKKKVSLNDIAEKEVTGNQLGSNASKPNTRISDKRGDPIFPPGLSKREKIRRIINATKATATASSGRELNIIGTTLATLGSAYGTAHMAAGLASRTEKGINEAYDKRDAKKDRDILIALARQRAEEDRMKEMHEDRHQSSYRLKNTVRRSINKSRGIPVAEKSAKRISIEKSLNRQKAKRESERR